MPESIGEHFFPSVLPSVVQGITPINHPMHHTFHVTVNFGLEGEAENALIRIQESEEFPAKKRAKFSLRRGGLNFLHI